MINKQKRRFCFASQQFSSGRICDKTIFHALHVAAIAPLTIARPPKNSKLNPNKKNEKREIFCERISQELKIGVCHENLRCCKLCELQQNTWNETTKTEVRTTEREQKQNECTNKRFREVKKNNKKTDKNNLNCAHSPSVCLQSLNQNSASYKCVGTIVYRVERIRNHRNFNTNAQTTWKKCL